MKNKRNKMKWYPWVILLCLISVKCTKYDAFDTYMPDGEIIYPQKADAVEIYPGKNRVQLEWVIIDPKVTSCVVYYEQGGIQGSSTVPIQGRSDYTNDTIRVIIPDLEETTYSFKIVSYDDFGNASVPVEIDETVYGEVYEKYLSNRAIKNSAYNSDEGLSIEWLGARDTEINIIVEYTDINGDNRTIIIPSSETSTSIPDFNVNEPLYYTTAYKPVPSAIDLFFAPKVNVMITYIPYWKNITADFLKNTKMPFTNTGILAPGGFYNLNEWIINAAAAENGTSAQGRGYVLSLWTWNNPTVDNGKVYQTIELEPGTYRFDATIYETRPNTNAYLVVALGNDLPNTNDVPQNSLGYIRVPDNIAVGALPTISTEFTISVKSTVFH